ncbi:MAG: GAF domain-containing protein [Dehalococcoidales bacterium]|nr:GAF domain-containing protein [Dehalococcoidales bacterium]
MTNANSSEGIGTQRDKPSGTRVREGMARYERLAEIVAQVTEIARRVFNASGSSVLLLDDRHSDLIVRVATGNVGKQLKGRTISTQRGIAGWVARNGEPLIVNDASQDPRFDNTVDRGTGFITKSVMCAPLVDKGKVIGVFEVVNKADGAGFTDNDLETLVSIARVAVLPICFFEEEETRKKLVALAVRSRYVEMRKKVIDILASYGRPAVPHILEIVNASNANQLRSHGLAKIEEITNKSDS